MQGDEIWQDDRPGWVAGHRLFWWTLAPGLAQDQKVNNFGNAHLVDRLRVCSLGGIGMWGYTPVGITGILVSLKH